MTRLHKKAVTILLQDGDIINLGPSGIRVRDAKLSPVLKLTPKTLWKLQDITIKAVKGRHKGAWVIVRKNILQLHGGSWIKKEYKRLLAEAKTAGKKQTK